MSRGRLILDPNPAPVVTVAPRNLCRDDAALYVGGGDQLACLLKLGLKPVAPRTKNPIFKVTDLDEWAAVADKLGWPTGRSEGRKDSSEE